MRRDVSEMFNKFAGREVPMHEEQKTMRIGCVIKKFTAVSLADPADPTLKEMSDEATKNGLKLRVLWPGKGSTDDYDRNRVNAHIEKGTDGKWHVGRKFDIG
ncbi:MAG: hypothetical protein ACAH83_05470 [Alphaproteobacteria bacterium]